jgi:hypothetical protein
LLPENQFPVRGSRQQMRKKVLDLSVPQGMWLEPVVSNIVPHFVSHSHYLELTYQMKVMHTFDLFL